MNLYPRFVVEDGRILFKIHVDGVERIAYVSEAMAFGYVQDLVNALARVKADTSHPLDADHPVPVR